MKILKADNPDRKKIDFKEIITKIGKKNLVIMASVAVIGFAVYLNWYLFSGINIDNTGAELPQEQAEGQQADASGSEESFFAVSAIDRQRARDEAREVLQTVVDSSDSEEAVNQALSDISKIAADIETEANIEALVKAKGFAECVAVISGSNANVVVKSDGLLPNEIAQIKEILYEEAEILPDNVKIIEKQ